MNRKNAGFTLIEVLIVIAIIGIAAAFSVPTFLKVLPNWRTKAAATDLFSNLQRAKLTAIRTGQNCVVTFSGNPDGGVPCQYQISIVNETFSLADYGSEVVFRGPVQGAIFPRFEGDTGAQVTWTLTFNSRGMVNGNAFNVNFASQKFSDTDPRRVYYRAGTTNAGVIQIQRYEGGTWN